MAERNDKQGHAYTIHRNKKTPNIRRLDGILSAKAVSTCLDLDLASM